MKRIISICLVAMCIISLVLGFAACSGEQTDLEAPDAVESEAPMETSIDPVAVQEADLPMHPLRNPLVLADGFIDGAIYEDGWIIFCLMGDAYPYSTLFIERVSPEGKRGEWLEIPWQFTGRSHIVGFDLTEEGHFQFLIRNHDSWIQYPGEVFMTARPGLNALLYVVYDQMGNLVTEPRVVLDLEAEEIRWVFRSLFLPSGDMILDASTEDRERLFIVLTPDETIRKERAIFGNLVMMRDGRVVGMVADGLLEFDQQTRRFGDELISDLDVRGIFAYPAPAESGFDLYVEHNRPEDHTWWLYGYHLETGMLTLHMSWDVAGFQGLNMVIPLSDGRMAVFREVFIHNHAWLFALTPIAVTHDDLTPLRYTGLFVFTPEL